MAIVKEKYSAQKINLLFQLLQGDYDEGNPREYDISVDDLKVVRRTTDPNRFFSHEDFINEETKFITISLYEGLSKRNTRYVYSLTGINEEDKSTLSGFETTLNEKLQSQKKDWAYEQLQKENEELQDQLDDQVQYSKQLEQKLTEEREKKVSIKDNWGDVLSIAMEGLVRRNTHLITGIPMIGQGLAGIVEQDNKRLELQSANGAEPSSESQIRFTKQTDTPGQDQLLSDEERKIHSYYKWLQKTFSSEELSTIVQIVALLSQNKENIEPVYEMLTEELKEEADDQNEASK